MTTPRPAPPRVRLFTAAMFVLALVLAFISSHTSSGSAPDVGLGDKAMHAIGYFVLAGLFLAMLTARGVRWPRRVALALLAGGLYGAFDEVSQALFGRSTELGDWLADMAGLLAALVVWEVAAAVARRRRRASAGD